MTRVLLLGLLTPVFAVFSPATLQLPSERVVPPAGEGDGKKQQLVAVAPPPREPWKNPLSGGTVTAIDGSSITIQGYAILVKGATHSELGWEGRKRTVTQTGNPLIITGTFPPTTGVRLFSDARGTITITHADGTTTEIRMSEQPNRRYLVSDALKAGWYGEGAGGTYTYRLADVQVGDVVDMRLGPYPVCEAITICRRPCGRVPPAPGDPVALRPRHPTDPPLRHEWINATQDWEEKGIPIPMRFLSPQERRERTAPPPREVSNPIPPSKP